MSSVRKRAPSVTKSAPVSAISKKKSLSKPVWDSTNSDLDQFKSTTDELDRRRQACQSKNIELIKYEKQRQAMLRDKKEQLKQPGQNSKAQLALLKEILYDDEQLKKMILKSDMTLKTVQDFFEDDGQQYSQNTLQNAKKQVKINMTLAPNVTDLNESNLPYNSSKPLNKQQKNSLYAAKVHNANNFSDTEDPTSDTESEIIEMRLKQAKQNEDFTKYRQLLELKQEMINKKLKTIPIAKTTTIISTPEQNDLDECIKMLSINSKNQSMNNEQNNDTEKINRLKELIKTYANSMNTPENQPNDNANNKSVLTNLNDEFKRAMSDLENKMYDFEKEIGQKKASECSIFKSILDGSSSGKLASQSSYTLSLIKIVSTLLDSQKEAIRELNHEKLKNMESNKQLDIHRKLIDGLTNEILCVKEQNEKIGTVYINQAHHQAKIDAELDQIRIMLRSSFQHSNTRPPIIDPTNPDLNNIIKPVAKQQQNTSQMSHQMRPMSCVGSINEYDRQNNVRYPLDEALNEVKSDKFIERLNAMLHQNGISQVNECQLNVNSLSCNNLASDSNDQNSNEVSNIRSSSAFGLGGNQVRFNNDFNNSSQSDFSAQIQELGANKAKAQQKLKQLQNENNFVGQSSSSNFSCQLGSSGGNLSVDNTSQNLSKLKSEQQLLKDQINLLNRQRECAQKELEILHVSSVSANNSKVSVSGGNGNGSGKKNFMQNLQSMEFNRVEINGGSSGISPNMSPIPNENVFQEGIEGKSSTHRFGMPSNGEVASARVVQKKNRD